MTIMQRVWKATEVDREGFFGLFTGLGGFLSALGIIVLPILAVLFWAFAIRGTFQSLISLFR